jgi:hypothetical protein
MLSGALDFQTLTNTVTKAPSIAVAQKQLQLKDSYYGAVSKNLLFQIGF